MIEVERLSGRRQRVGEEAAEERPQLARAGDRSEHHFFARPVGEIGGDHGTEVGGDQQLLQLPEQRVVDRTIGLQHGAQTARQVFLRPLESLAEALAEGGKELHGGSDGSTRRVMTAPLAPRRGIGRPLSSRVTPPALPIESTNG